MRARTLVTAAAVLLSAVPVAYAASAQTAPSTFADDFNDGNLNGWTFAAMPYTYGLVPPPPAASASVVGGAALINGTSQGYGDQTLRSATQYDLTNGGTVTLDIEDDSSGVLGDNKYYGAPMLGDAYVMFSANPDDAKSQMARERNDAYWPNNLPAKALTVRLVDNCRYPWAGPMSVTYDATETGTSSPGWNVLNPTAECGAAPDGKWRLVFTPGHLSVRNGANASLSEVTLPAGALPPTGHFVMGVHNHASEKYSNQKDGAPAENSVHAVLGRFDNVSYPTSGGSSPTTTAATTTTQAPTTTAAPTTTTTPPSYDYECVPDGEPSPVAVGVEFPGVCTVTAVGGASSTSTTLSPTTTSTVAVPTTTAPAATTTSPAPTTTATPPPTGLAFSETFGSDQSARFDWQLHSAGSGAPCGTPNIACGEIEATERGEHNMACGGPTTHRHVDAQPVHDFLQINPATSPLIWYCNPSSTDASGHMMTFIETSGVVTLSFSPKQTFTDVRRVCFDVNTNNNIGAGKWINVFIAPVARVADNDGGRFDFADEPSLDPSAEVPASDVFHLKYFDGSLLGFSGTTKVMDWWAWGRRASEAATRFTQCVEQTAPGQLTYTRDFPADANGDGVMDPGVAVTENQTAPGTLPDGPVRVIFQDSSYNPNKHGGCEDQCSPSELLMFGGTWHWDNIQVAVE